MSVLEKFYNITSCRMPVYNKEKRRMEERGVERGRDRAIETKERGRE